MSLIRVIVCSRPLKSKSKVDTKIFPRCHDGCQKDWNKHFFSLPILNEWISLSGWMNLILHKTFSFCYEILSKRLEDRHWIFLVLSAVIRLSLYDFGNPFRFHLQGGVLFDEMIKWIKNEIRNWKCRQINLISSIFGEDCIKTVCLINYVNGDYSYCGGGWWFDF